MDNHQPKVDKVPHSNSANVPEALRETPVEEFDMPLKDAVEAGKVSTLPSTEAPEPIYNFESPVTNVETKTSVEAPKKKNRVLITLGSIGAGLAITAGAIFGVKAASENTNEAPVKNPDDTTQVEEEPGTNTGSEGEGTGTGEVDNIPSTSGENDPAVTEANKEQLSESLKLGTDLSPQALGEKTIDNLSRWSMAGATYETWNNQDFSITPEEYAAGIASTNADVYKEAIFGANADTNPNSNVQNYITGMETNNARNLNYAIQTFSNEEYTNSNSANIETFKLTYTAEEVSIVSESEDKLVLNVRFLIDNNAEKTMYGESPAVKLEAFITYVKDGDSYVVQDFDQRSL